MSQGAWGACTVCVSQVIDQLCWKGPTRGGDCWPTIGEAFSAAHKGHVSVAEGVSLDGKQGGGKALERAALAAAKAAGAPTSRGKDVPDHVPNGLLLPSPHPARPSCRSARYPCLSSTPVPAADQVVLCVGLGNADEHEGHDRTDTRLPGTQESFARQVLALGKPTVLGES